MGKFEFKPGGLDELIKSPEIQAMVTDRAEQIAENIRGEGHMTSDGSLDVYVEVKEYQTDRAAAEVYIDHPAAEAIQAKYGTFTRAIGG
jgi:hypothetical protein